MDALDAIFTRRSTRKMKDELPPAELIDKVIEAGRAAPSGSDMQTTHFIAITDKKVLADLARIVQDEFAKMEEEPDMYVALRHCISAAKKGKLVFHYNAPLLIVTANQKGLGNAMADSACALENMMIAANALDLGACWINQLHWLTDTEAVQTYMRGLGLKEDETITGGLILGYAAGGMPDRSVRQPKGNPVTWVR